MNVKLMDFHGFLRYISNQVFKNHLHDQENPLACTRGARSRFRARCAPKYAARNMTNFQLFSRAGAHPSSARQSILLIKEMHLTTLSLAYFKKPKNIIV